MQATDRLLVEAQRFGDGKSQLVSKDDSELPSLSIAIIRKLNETATSKLAETTRRTSSDASVLAEVEATKKLLDSSTQLRTR